MEIIKLNKKQLENLQPLELDKKIFNTEAQIFKLNEKKQWIRNPKLFKKLYIDDGDVFSNKLATITSLINYSDILKKLEIILPEKLVAINSDLVGFTMPYVDNFNFEVILRDKSISDSKKIEYFKQIGALFEKMKEIRKYTELKDFYLNDVHEGNFIVSKETDKIIAIDLDSCKINNNKPFPAKYLNPSIEFGYLDQKYMPYDREHMGFFVPDENTDMYCYSIMLLNYFYGDNILKVSIEEYYKYLQYLKDIGFPTPLVDIFSNLYSLANNNNPSSYLDELPKDHCKSNKLVFNYLNRK